MQLIQTKWIPETYIKPNRIKAFCSAGNVTVGADSTPFASHTEEAHKWVAQLLADKLKWKGQLVGGSTKDGFGFTVLDEFESLMVYKKALESENPGITNIEKVNAFILTMTGNKPKELHLEYLPDGSLRAYEIPYPSEKK